jgi:ribonuclease P protein subunit RPR2|tara:strand:- start:1232 stop:1543 length:312 start_codon:yes stop_codon:yes gene_type:complete
MKKKFKGTKKQQKESALAEVRGIFDQAKQVFDKKPDLAHKYAKKARRIALKYKIKLPLVLKRRICKNCHSYLVPGKNLRVRTRKGNVVYYCLECKKFMRVGYK